MSISNPSTNSPTAPRTPDTERVFDCVDETTTEAKLSLDVSTTALTLARSEYDQAIASSEAAQLATATQIKQVADQELEIIFNQTQLAHSQERQTELDARQADAQAQVTLCLNDPDSCTVEGKKYKMKAANDLQNEVLQNITDISSLQEKISAGQTQLGLMQTQLATMEQGAAVSIQAAKEELDAVEKVYINKRETQKKNQKDYDALHTECMFNAFHTNQIQLTELRQDLARWNIIVDVPQTVGEDQDDRQTGNDPNANGTSSGDDTDDKSKVAIVAGKNDCRYKEISACQGRNLQLLTRETRKACREMITPVCFEFTYETFWTIDFVSVLAIPWAILGCSWETNFSYSLCMGSYGYIMLFNALYELGFEF